MYREKGEKLEENNRLRAPAEIWDLTHRTSGCPKKMNSGQLPIQWVNNLIQRRMFTVRNTPVSSTGAEKKPH